MLSSSPSSSSAHSPKSLGVFNFDAASTFSPRGSNVSSDAEFVHHLIQQHLDISSPSSGTRQRASSLQPLAQKPSFIPLSPSHQHFHLLMSNRQQQQPYTLPPIESSSPTNRQLNSESGNGLFQKRSLQNVDNPQSLIKEKLKFQLQDVQKSGMRQSLSADNFKSKQVMPLSARTKKAEKEWEHQPVSPPNVTCSWVAPKIEVSPVPAQQQTETLHRWNQRMDKKLRDLEFHYSGGPTRAVNMKYLNDPNTEVRLPFKIDAEMPTEIVTVKPQKKKKRADKTRIIEK